MIDLSSDGLEYLSKISTWSSFLLALFLVLQGSVDIPTLQVNAIYDILFIMPILSNSCVNCQDLFDNG